MACRHSIQSLAAFLLAWGTLPQANCLEIERLERPSRLRRRGGDTLVMLKGHHAQNGGKASSAGRMDAHSCLGDMCVHKDPFSHKVGPMTRRLIGLKDRQRLQAANFSQLSAIHHVKKLRLPPDAGCGKVMQSKKKLMLMPIVPMYHGSTALETIFMSSRQITTICSAGTWQCEARLDFDGRPRCIRENLLPRYSEYWDMDKPVLFDKGPRGMHEKVTREYKELTMEHRTNPVLMDQLGMKYLSYAYVLMWRPICLSLLSSHARGAIRKDAKQFALDELQWLEDLVSSHQWLTAKGVPVLVTNLADMMWRPEESKKRLEDFLPCLGPLNFDYVPQLGKDIFPENDFKAEGSLESYGNSVHPTKVGYSVEQGFCSGEGALFTLLSSSDLKRAQRAMQYLISKS